jgi:hypothetical protein
MDGLGASNIKPSRFAEEVGLRSLFVSVALPTQPRLVTLLDDRMEAQELSQERQPMRETAEVKNLRLGSPFFI